MDWSAHDKSRYDMLEIAYHDAWLEVNNPGFASFAVITY
jgi:hypothetical protein